MLDAIFVRAFRLHDFDEDGNVEWVKQLYSTGDNSIYDVNLLDDGSSIVSGYFSGTTNFSGSNITSSGY